MAKNAVRVGLDIEQTALIGAQVRGGKQGNVLQAVAVRPLPEGLVFEGEVVDADGLAAELKAFWKQAGFGGKRFSVGIANQKVVVRTLEMPVVDPKELQAAVEFQAQDAIPIPLDQAVLDYDVLGTFTDSENVQKQRVLVVAAQRDMVEQFVAAGRKAGLTVENVDLQAFALVRALAPRIAFLDQGAPAGAEATALVNIGTGTTNIVVVAGGEPRFTRVVNMGSEDIVKALMEHRGVERADADRMRLEVGLSGDAVAAGDYEPDTVEEVRQVADGAAEAIADELRRSIDYYHSTSQDGGIAAVLLSGEGALTRNACDYFAGALHMPVTMGNPLQYIAENRSKMSQAELEVSAPRLAIAVGLALDDEE